jgi:F-type H+-transporting ATPase subunit b
LASASEAAPSGLSVNFFWVIVAALNFIVFFAILSRFAFGPLSRMLAERKTRVERGLADAEQAGKDRAAASAERDQLIRDARREANDLLARAQKVAEEQREVDVAATREEIERLRKRATADIVAERDHALADLRAEVADLALMAAGRVVGETMTDVRQKRLVEEFLRDRSLAGGGTSSAGGRGN